MRKHCILFLSIILFSSPAMPQSPDWTAKTPDSPGWITVRGSCPDVQVTGVDAQRRAVENARRKAVEQKCGVYIAASSLVDAGILKGDFKETFTFGWVAKDSIKDRGVNSTTIGGYDYLVTEYWVELACSVATRESAFNSSISLCASLDKSTYRSGETGTLEILCNEDCYLTIFNVWADGTLGILCPNEFLTEMPVKAGQTVKVPDPAVHGFNLAFSTLPGDPENTEYLKIVASKNNHPFFGGVGTAALQKIDMAPGVSIYAITDRKAALEEFMLWFTSIPPEEYAVEQVMYRVVGE